MGVCTPQGSLIADLFWASSGLEPPWCVCARYLASSTHPGGAQVPTWPQDPLWAPLARTEQGQRGVLGRGAWGKGAWNDCPRAEAPRDVPRGSGLSGTGGPGAHIAPELHGMARHCTAPWLSTALPSTAQFGTTCMVWHRSSQGTAQLRTALHGTTRHSLALFGTAQHSLALRGTAQHPSHAQHPWPCLALPCSHQHRTARHGTKPLALAAALVARRCMARLGSAWHSLVLPRAVLHGLAPLSCTQHGSARLSTAGLSLAVPQPHTGLLALAHLGLAQLAGHGTARFGSAWFILVQHGLARLVLPWLGTAHHAMP